MTDGPAGRRVTVRDIAAHSGMSIATVSRVLNGQSNVAPETRELVQRAAERLRVQRPVKITHGAVYLRCPYLLTDYFGLIVSSVAETLALHGRAVVLDAGEAAQRATVLPSLPSRPGTEGAIVVLPPEPGEQLTALRASGFPFVVVDPRTPVPPDIAAVSAAHFAGSRSITAHLAGLGHRRIGVIAGPHNWRWPASTTRPRSARWPPRPSAACGSRRTSRSPASTTSTWPRPRARCSPPSASRWPRWAGWPSAC